MSCHKPYNNGIKKNNVNREIEYKKRNKKNNNKRVM